MAETKPAGKPLGGPSSEVSETERQAMRNVWLLGGTSFFTDFSSEMSYPLIGILVKSVLGAPAWALGVIEGVAESLASILKLFSGALSDWLGRRKELTIGGYSSSVVGKFIIFLSGVFRWWPFVLIGRVVDRFGKGVRTAPRDALIADGIPQERRGKAFGIQRALDHAGAVIGSVACFLILTQLHLLDESLHKVFLYAVIPGVVGVVLLFFIKEVRRPAGSEAEPGGPETTGSEEAARPSLYERWLSLDRRLRVFLVIVFIFSLANFSNQFMLLRLKDLGYDTPTVVLHYILFNVLAALLSYPAGHFSDRFGRKGIVVGGYLFYGGVYLGLALAGKGMWTWGLFAAYGVYLAMIEGVEKALVGDLAPPQARATALGLYAMLVGAGLLPASLLAGYLYGFNPAIPFYLAGAMSTAAGLALWVFLKMGEGGEATQ